MNLRSFVIVDKDGTPQGMDKNSGGYLYGVDWVGDICYWAREHDAQRYCEIFNDPNDKGYRVVQCDTHIYSSV